MNRLSTLSIALLAVAAVAVLAQTPPPPSASPLPTPASLRAALLAELHSTHDKAEWFTR